MATKLKSYFPLLWEKSELLDEIRKRKDLSAIYNKWSTEQQEQFLNFCTGVSGIKFLYDGFFKELMSPEYTPGSVWNCFRNFCSYLLTFSVKISRIKLSATN